MISIITPSLNNSEWLKLCVASVADQAGAEVEHIVQDAGSTDGTLDWLLSDTRVSAFVEKDQGMYDAVNRGFRKSKGDILAYLNCDEQYLPGALSAVAAFFNENPGIDVVFSNTIVVDREGRYVCHRKAVEPLKYHTWVCHLAAFTCSTFIRRRVISDEQIFFDINWKDVGDAAWVLQLLERRIKFGVLDRFTSVFADAGGNMALQPRSLREKAKRAASAPFWARSLKPYWVLHHRLRRFVAGHYSQKPFVFESYDPGASMRSRHDVGQPTSIWRSRL